jgi:hypothetical protein
MPTFNPDGSETWWSKRRKLVIGGSIATVGLLIVAIIALANMTWSKADGGTVIAVRNGGTFDDNSFREVIQPNSSLTFTGWASQEHPYPASQRYFKVSSTEGDADTSEVINVPTKDGVAVGVEGTWYFELNTDPEVLQRFDDEFGTRTYPYRDGLVVYPWDGDTGWSAFLDSQLSPAALTASRQAIQTVDCDKLVASCALIRGGASSAAVEEAAAEANPQTIATIQQDMAATFKSEVDRILGEGTLVNIDFTLSKVTLPQGIQDQINAAFAKITEANGNGQANIDAAKAAALAATENVKVAEQEARANEQRQAGYNACPVCQEIDLRKAIPQSVTVWAPGAQTSVPIG